MSEEKSGFTQILSQAKSGDRGAEEQVWESIYEQLKKLAHHQLRSGWRGGTIDTTSLVHELYLKLGDKDWGIKDRGHFMALSCKAMRHILVQNSRQRSAQKRGGEQFAVTLKDDAHGDEGSRLDVVALDEALNELKEVNERLVQVVEMRLFGGFSLEEIAKTMDVSSRTSERDWLKAKMFLYQKLA